MIHLIYIYFIVNAFLAGYEYRWDKHKGVALVMFFIGLPVILLDYILTFIRRVLEWFSSQLHIKGWYRLYFTNYFAKLGDGTVRVRQAQYWGHEVNGLKVNAYGRFFLRQLDKKYNYGITKPLDHE